MKEASLPSRERGLKSVSVRTINGVEYVAPFAGAWIEILGCSSLVGTRLSLPSRERGLK